MIKCIIFSIFLLCLNLQAATQALPLNTALGNGLNINEAYKQVNEIWRDLVEKTPEKIAQFDLFTANKQSKILENRELNEHFEDLITVGRIRSNYIRYLFKKRGSFLQDNIDNGLIGDLGKEIKIIPMRWFGNILIFSLEIKNHLTEGFKGFKELFKIVLEFLSVLILPIIGIFVVRKTEIYLENQVINFKSMRFKGANQYRRYRLLSQIRQYINWPLYFILFSYLKTVYTAYDFWFSAIKLFIIYKFFLLVTVNIFKSLKNTDKSNELRAERDAKLIARIVFFSYFFLLFSQSVIGQGITFHLLKESTFWILLFVSTILLARWNNELAAIIEKYNWGKFNILVAETLKKKRYFFLALPALITVLIYRLTNIIVDFLERFDFFKQISAQVFKKKLESSDAFQETDLESLPEEYIQLFKPIDRELETDELVNSYDETLKKVKSEIETWKHNPMEENSIAIYGDKGCGKSTLIKKLLHEFDPEIRVLHLNMNNRFSKASDLLREIGNLIDIELSESFAPLLKKDKEMQKTLIVIDSAQNIFLTQMGGFEAYKAFTELINLRLENIFWFAAFNNASWNFLQTVFKENQSFRISLELKSWKEEAIKALVLNRHKKLDYNLSYSRILRVVQGGYDQEAQDNAEELFFRVLWEQSSGNPRVALYLWLSSLNFNGDKLLSVGLPHGDDLNILGKLNDDALFVYAAIMRHENLSAKETTSITNIPESAVRFALKLGLENNFLLRRDNGQYTFNSRFQYTLNRHLKKKNFILGN